MDDGSSPNPVSEPDAASDADAPNAQADIALARDLVLRAHPEAVQELITGNSLAELLASVPVAEAAFARIAGATRDEAARSTAAAVPGGGGVRSTWLECREPGTTGKDQGRTQPLLTIGTCRT